MILNKQSHGKHDFSDISSVPNFKRTFFLGEMLHLLCKCARGETDVESYSLSTEGSQTSATWGTVPSCRNRCIRSSFECVCMRPRRHKLVEFPVVSIKIYLYL